MWCAPLDAEEILPVLDGRPGNTIKNHSLVSGVGKWVLQAQVLGELVVMV